MVRGGVDGDLGKVDSLIVVVVVIVIGNDGVNG